MTVTSQMKLVLQYTFCLFVQTKFCQKTLEMLSAGLGKLGGYSGSWQRAVFHLAVISHTSSYQLLLHRFING